MREELYVVVVADGIILPQYTGYSKRECEIAVYLRHRDEEPTSTKKDGSEVVAEFGWEIVKVKVERVEE